MGFETDVRPLFREHDRYEMDYVFDLWSYDDVRRYADSILERVEDGTMPCDEPWPDERIAVLRTWIAAGCPP
jgi:hypothetical protein